MASYFQIFILPKDDVTRSDVEKALDKAVDWFRFHEGNYVVYSTSRLDAWMLRLQPLVVPSGSLFITKIDAKLNNGLMDKEFWEWFHKNNRHETAD